MSELSYVDELLSFFKALSEKTRLRILSLLIDKSYAVEEIAEILGLSSATISHHLSILSKAGLVSARAEGHYNIYSFNLASLQKKASRILSSENLSPIAKNADLEAYDRKVLKNFLNDDGRVDAFPAQRKKEEVILRYAAGMFKRGRKYSEEDVNQILERLSDDTARLRRNLVEFGFMAREGEGGSYWLIDT